MTNIAGVLLAAGSSRRFGGDKRMLRLPSGKTMLEASIGNCKAVLDTVIVVLRHDDQDLANHLQVQLNMPGLAFYCAPDSDKGMAHSIHGAIGQVLDYDAAMIMLADLPYIQGDTYEVISGRYADVAHQYPIIVPTYEGKRGHPVLFDHHYFAEIQELTGDQGARSIIHAHPAQLIELSVTDPGILADIDRPSDA